MMDPSRSKSRRRRRKTSVKAIHQDLSSYIGFNVQSIICLAMFALIYSATLLVLVPLLSDSLEETLKDSPVVLEAAGKLRGQWRKWRQLARVTDESLLQEAIVEFESRKDFMRHIH